MRAALRMGSDGASPSPNHEKPLSPFRHLSIRATRRQALAWLMAAVAFTVQPGTTPASEPEIVRARVPAGSVSRWFPAGTELRVMPAREFEALVERATNGLARQRGLEPPRLIRASHRARLENGALVGQSRLVIGAASSGAADFVLAPWSAAIQPSSPSAKLIGARDSGELSVWIDQKPDQTIVLDWELQPSPPLTTRTGGRSFSLSLPGCETTALELELPAGWIPWCRRGWRRRPAAAARTDWVRWEIGAEAGEIDVRLGDSSHGESFFGSRCRLTSTTTVNMRMPTLSNSDGSANWTTDWSLELDPRNPLRLAAELDPGLELIDVRGPAVRGYHKEQRGPATFVEIDIDSNAVVKTQTSLRFLAHARVPAEGTWPVPAVRPLSATWIGGSTSVILDEFHALEECREKHGRRVTAPATAGAGARVKRLDFEAESPRSVAELVLRQPPAGSACTVRGQLMLENGPARVECALDWSFDQKIVPEIEIDLSPGWIPDYVRLAAGMSRWPGIIGRCASGATRMTVALPASVLSQKDLALTVGAGSTAHAVHGPLDLPAVRPVGARIADDAWLMWVNHRTMVRPLQAQGLAWIDPMEVPGLATATQSGGACARDSPGAGSPSEGARASIDSGSSKTRRPRSERSRTSMARDTG